MRQTRGWLEQNADLEGRFLKVLETETPSWKPSPAPTPKPHFFPARGEKREGDKGAACRLLTPDFLNGIKSSGKRAVLPSRSQLNDCKQKIIRKEPKAFISVQPTRVAESARAAGDWDNGVGDRVRESDPLPHLPSQHACPRQNDFSLPQNPAQNPSFCPVQGASGITGGPPPLSLVPWPRGLRGPRAALSATPWCCPTPGRWKLVCLAGSPARDSRGVWTARPVLRRVSWTLKRAANCPLPHRQDGGAIAHVSPLAQLCSSLGLSGAGGSGTSWSKAREGTWADPLPPPQKRAGDRPPPPPLSSRPSLP